MDSVVIKTVAFSSVVLGVVAAGAAAQDAFETGGIQLSFGLGLRLEAQDNRSLSPTNADSSYESVADLSFGLLTETQTQRFSFDFGGKLRAIDDTLNTADDGFVEPFAELRYDLTSAAAHLALNASLRETDLSDNDVLSDDGLDVITGNGATRRRTLLEARLDWGEDAPLGFGVFARREDNTYSGGTPTGLDGTGLNDNFRNTVGASTRMDLSPAAALTVSLSYSAFDEDTVPGTRETISLDNILTLERPRGPVTISLGATSTEEGERISTALGRTLELPSGILMGQIGATRGTSGDVNLTGAMSYTHALPRGALNVGLSREVTSDNQDDTERLNTRFNLGYSMELSPLSALAFNADWAQTEQPSNDLTSVSTTLGATYSRELTADWDLDVGYRHRIRDDDTAGRADSNAVFLELRRTFVTRF